MTSSSMEAWQSLAATVEEGASKLLGLSLDLGRERGLADELAVTGEPIPSQAEAI